VLAPQAEDRMKKVPVRADLDRVGVRDVLDLLTRFRIGDAEVSAYAGEGRLNTDDNALVEFSAPWELHLDTAARNAAALARAGGGGARYVDGDWASPRERARFLTDLAARTLAAREWRQAEEAARDALALARSADGLWVLGEALRRRRRPCGFGEKPWPRMRPTSPPG
jgi:hypothetical protein